MKKIKVCIILALMQVLFASACMAATLTTEIARVREYLYQTDSSNSVYTDALITENINAGQMVLENLLSYSANKENYLITACAYTTGAVSITSPTGLKKILGLYDVTTLKPYIQIKPEEAHRFYLATTKDPVFLMVGGTIKIYPLPTTSGTIEVSYIKAYTPLASSSDTVTVQDRYLHFLTWAASWSILNNDNQPNRAAGIYKTLSDQITIENNSTVNTNVTERVSNGGTK